MNLYKTTFPKRCYHKGFLSLRASSPIWASEASLARTRERGAQIGELARMLRLYQDTTTAWLRRLEGGGGTPFTYLVWNFASAVVKILTTGPMVG